MRAASILNSASRTRSEVGRVPAGGTRSRRPPAMPATIRVIGTPRPTVRRSPIRDASAGAQPVVSSAPPHSLRGGLVQAQVDQQIAALDLLHLADGDALDGAGAGG